MALSRKRKRYNSSAGAKMTVRSGLSPTLKKVTRATLSPSFGLFLERNHSFGVFQSSQFFPKWSEYALGTPLHVGEIKFTIPAKTSAEL